MSQTFGPPVDLGFLMRLRDLLRAGGESDIVHALSLLEIHLRQRMTEPMVEEKVDHPRHYNQSPSGIEAIDVIEHLSFNVGTAVKYLWRMGLKSGESADTDLRKAIWYIKRERKRLAPSARGVPLSARVTPDPIIDENAMHLSQSAPHTCCERCGRKLAGCGDHTDDRSRPAWTAYWQTYNYNPNACDKVRARRYAADQKP